jgi:hypothetical protein
MFPVFQLLKDQKTQSFQMTEEALAAITEVKSFLKKETIIYNIDFDQPLYIMTDASQVASGAFLYQLQIYDKNEESKKQLLATCGPHYESDNSVFLVPGMNPGKNCPIVTDYVRDKENLFMPDTMDPTLTVLIRSKNDVVG